MVRPGLASTVATEAAGMVTGDPIPAPPVLSDPPPVGTLNGLGLVRFVAARAGGVLVRAMSISQLRAELIALDVDRGLRLRGAVLIGEGVAGIALGDGVRAICPAGRRYAICNGAGWVAAGILAGIDYGPGVLW